MQTLILTIIIIRCDWEKEVIKIGTLSNILLSYTDIMHNVLCYRLIIQAVKAGLHVKKWAGKHQNVETGWLKYYILCEM